MQNNLGRQMLPINSSKELKNLKLINDILAKCLIGFVGKESIIEVYNEQTAKVYLVSFDGDRVIIDECGEERIN